MPTHPEPENRKNTTDAHAPDRPEVRNLSETEKRQMEAGDEAEHEQGQARADLQPKSED